MPLYEYECKDHGRFEEILSIKSASGLSRCPKCGKLSPKVMSTTNFALTGDGWSRDNYGARARAQGKIKEG